MYGRCTDAKRAKRARRSAASPFGLQCTQHIHKSAHKKCTNLHIRHAKCNKSYLGRPQTSPPPIWVICCRAIQFWGSRRLEAAKNAYCFKIDLLRLPQDSLLICGGSSFWAKLQYPSKWDAAIYIYIYGNVSIIQCPGRYRPFMTRQSIASEASFRMNLHIRGAKIYAYDVLKSTNKTW